MPSSHRKTPLSGDESSMAGSSGRVLKTLLECEDQPMRDIIQTAAAGAKNLSDANIVNLICSGFPDVKFSRCNRNLLIERVAKISPLSCRIGSAADEPEAKRPKIDDGQNVNRQIEGARASTSASSSDSNGRELCSARRDANGCMCIVEMIGDLRQGNELGASNEDKWPMFCDIGGECCLGSEMLEDLKNAVIVPMRQLKLRHYFVGKPTTAILLHGPPGCGKTMLARAIGNEARMPFYETSAAALKSGVSGILELFLSAYKNAPSIVFIDEIDALTSETESLSQCPVRQLIACMNAPVNDGSDSERSNSRPDSYVLTIGATNKPNALDLSLRQRFDREFFLDVPGKDERRDILSVLTSNYKVEKDFGFEELVGCTQGFVAGDLVKLVNTARMFALNRVINQRSYENSFNDGVELYETPFSDEELEELTLTMCDVLDAFGTVRPSAKMEDFSTTPSTNWDDVGGLQLLKLELERRIVKRIKFPKVYTSLGEIGVKNLPNSFFLYGPPGCGKTLIVQALAKEAGAHFMHIKGTEISKFSWNKLMVENIFKCAKTHPPCIVFFDELDIYFTDKDLEKDEDEWLSEEYAELRNQLRNVQSESHVYVIAKTSRLEIVDRMPLIKEVFGRVLYAPLPTPEERGEILKALAGDKPIDARVDLMALGEDVACENFSGSDLFALKLLSSPLIGHHCPVGVTWLSQMQISRLH
ncbi:cell division control protein 48 homolog C-like isoform X2 [Salvia hispanica]|uniref:cell division control protein 48 homolog C-like isoform X2 n=1 Tax=Salvia hispanica TaxID=49212 RepID=UPI0020098F1E|nr:cell division control protein 48 homolog C-like isoform X2 [Salvia hispanica]